MTDSYTAVIVEVPGEGIRLRPTPGEEIPELPNELNLLAISIALALGHAAYEHHPEPRVTGVQTIEALIAGDAVMPWRAGQAEEAQYVSCARSSSGAWTCQVQAGTPEAAG
jgi:hypothetical protein